MPGHNISSIIDGSNLVSADCAIPGVVGTCAERVVRRDVLPDGPSRALAAADARRPLPKRVEFDYGQRSLLLVAGVSGSGKTTFIDKLSRDELPIEVISALPPDIRSWAVVSRKVERHRLRRWLHAANEPARGQILHHEITGPLSPTAGVLWPSLYSVKHDVLLRRRLAAAQEIIVVIVCAPSRQLIHQLSARSILLHVPAPLRPLMGWLAAPLLQRLESALPNWVTRNAAKLLGRRWRHRAEVRDRNDRLLQLYAEAGALEAIHQHWVNSLLEECGARIKHPILYIKPTPGRRFSREFRLAQEACV